MTPEDNSIAVDTRGHADARDGLDFSTKFHLVCGMMFACHAPVTAPYAQKHAVLKVSC